MANWYLFRDNQTHGPYAEEQIREWIRTGQVLPADKLCREGDQNWSSADMLPEFAGEAAKAPPPSPGAWRYAMSTAELSRDPAAKDRATAGVLAILLGWLGIHHFYLGNTTIGIVYLLIALCSFGTIAPVLGIVDGIIYLTKPEDQFQRNYRNWFCSGP
jgi:TM2 domain-containing membrane protein YozV